MREVEFLKEQNPWWIAKEKIRDDVDLQKLAGVRYKWQPSILNSFALEKDVIYTLRGSRQIGKTTLLKLLVENLLIQHPKENILYFTCNNIDNYKEIIEIITMYLDWVNNAQRKFIFIDEITFVEHWTRGIKHLTDIGRLRNCALILTGSNSHDLKYEIERMPGRRGEDADLDKILHPVSFREYVGFTNPGILEKIVDVDSAKRAYPFYKKELQKYLNNFLLTGGFIQTINSFTMQGKVGIDIYQQYLSWILGDLAKMGRKESYSRQIFQQVIEHMTTNIGFDTIAKKTSIQSHLTVDDYVDIMESSFIVKVLYQIDLNRKIAVSRRTKKIYFQDMFLLWVFLGYVFGLSDYFLASTMRINDPLFRTKIIENLVMSQLIKLENSVTWSNIVFFFRTTNQVEVDFIVRDRKGKLIPIEVKYKDKAAQKDFLNLDKIDRQRGIIVSKEDLSLNGKKWILPVEVFLLLKNEEWLRL